MEQEVAQVAKLREGRMADVRVEVELENAIDRERADIGDIPEGEVRAARVQVLADSGARMLMLPEELAHALGLRERRRAMVTYADERREERPVAGVVTVRAANRSSTGECIVGPAGSEPLLGQIELESMDLLVDCGEQRLVPRPESPLLPLIPMK